MGLKKNRGPAASRTKRRDGPLSGEAPVQATAHVRVGRVERRTVEMSHGNGQTLRLIAELEYFPDDNVLDGVIRSMPGVADTWQENLGRLILEVGVVGESREVPRLRDLKFS